MADSIVPKRKCLPGARTPDLIGMTFGRWTVKEFAGRGRRGAAMWHCECECGAKKVVQGTSLLVGNSRSCGCWRSEKAATQSRTHGQDGTRLHNIWSSLKQRTINPNNAAYARYGGRGITVHPEWCESFAAFERYVSALPGFDEPDMQLDRIGNDGNYEPGNVRWATSKTNSRNRHNTICVEFRGQSKPLAEWCELIGLSYGATYGRLRRGWSAERAFSIDAAPEGNSPNGIIWDTVYVVRSGAEKVVKPGIMSSSSSRISEHQRDGFDTVVRLYSDLPATTPWLVEQTVLAAVDAAGIEPVRGREYFPDEALPVILRVLDSHPAIANR